MNFLAPWYIPVLAAAATIPPLVLLYFLKLKRRELPIASTLLWRRSVEDLQVNSPFQKLRSNLLLILQLLILILAALAIGEPVRRGSADIEQSMTLLIDQSASMGADEGDGQIRLSIAKEEALKVVDGMTTTQRAMVITFADRANVLT
ncbi:MAG: BatA and WFA domain-containing protein, partial [Phycisphaerae bacterium]|nr:BatA and WFA domain-containing protein [Phycisphaerae bacterium]